MERSTETKQKADLRDYLAAERTFLAWIRTGLALMGFGFVVARFGLFLRQLQFFRQPGSASSTGLSALLTELTAKQLEIFKEALPHLMQIGVILTSTAPSHRPALQAVEAS